MFTFEKIKNKSMKKILILCCAFAIAVACKEEPKDYVTLSGKITDKNSDSLVVRTRTYSKIIKVANDGTFKDTLKVEQGIHNIFDGKKHTSAFLKNGLTLNLTLDTKQFDETIKFTGEGSETNNYLAKKALLRESVFSPALFDEKEDVFKTKVSEIVSEFSDLLEGYKNVDSTIYASEKESIGKMSDGLLKAYSRQREKANGYAELIGTPSPSFENYENIDGTKTSLADLKGKYVYVDVWATWCGPCKAEIPSLKKVEAAYHGKNIEFVSISVDKAKDHDKWKSMIAEKELGGIQLFADNNWKFEFIQGYKINSIPRFILIDPNGNIVSPDAPRPSSKKLIELFNEHKI